MSSTKFSSGIYIACALHKNFIVSICVFSTLGHYYYTGSFYEYVFVISEVCYLFTRINFEIWL